MTEKGKRYVLKDGKFVEGKASPQLLDEEMRNLPSELVTKEEADPDKIHELDPPHIREALKYEFHKKLVEGGPEEKTIGTLTQKERNRLRARFPEAPRGKNVPIVSQQQLDVVRLRVIKSLVDSMLQAGLVDLDVKHLWFPENNVNIYQLREGNPPADSQRPKHLRGYRLEIDIQEIPQAITDMLRELGVYMPDIPKHELVDGELREEILQ